MANNDKHLGTVEIKMPNGEYFTTEVCREGDKLITGTFTNTGLLRDQWEVSVEEYYSQQEALQELYEQLEEYANSQEDPMDDYNYVGSPLHY
jgi:hypothetical protein